LPQGNGEARSQFSRDDFLDRTKPYRSLRADEFEQRIRVDIEFASRSGENGQARTLTEFLAEFQRIRSIAVASESGHTNANGKTGLTTQGHQGFRGAHQGTTSPTSREFGGLELDVSIVGQLARAGITNPTSIQREAIPPMFAGRNVVAQAQTGSGKTLAFVLPILKKVFPSPRASQALIVAPTHELVIQISEVISRTKLDSAIRVVSAYGGRSRSAQMHWIDQGAHILVATPGRLIDFINTFPGLLNQVRTVILDEADRMLDMGFIGDVRFILKSLVTKPQIGLFSATIPDGLEELIQEHVYDPMRIQLQNVQAEKPKITESFYRMNNDKESKFRVLSGILGHENAPTLIFCRYKDEAKYTLGANQLSAKLKESDYDHGVVHGNRAQWERERVLAEFRSGRIHTLVTTGVLGRGVDIPDIRRIINYDVPSDPEDYVHQIGRTARAGREGVAFTLVSEWDMPRLQRVQEYLNRAIRVEDPPVWTSIQRFSN